jgi:phage host-nuclease inhibitor protein Gam
MPPKKNRVKAPASAPVPQNLDEANVAVREIGGLNRELTRIEVAMAEELAAVKERYEAKAAPLKESVAGLTTALQTWCEANRVTLTKDGKIKTAALPAGEVGWRMRPPRCTVRGEESVLDNLRRLGLVRFIRTREEVNKEACLNEPQLATTVPGISISQGEYFFVVPFEAELSEVSA